MPNYKLKIANYVFEIDSLYDYLLTYGKDYLTDEAPNFDIITSLEDIKNERIRCYKTNERLSNQKLTDEYFESTFIMTEMAEYLIDKNILLFHGATVSKDNESYMFLGMPGTGKSTHVKLWMDYLNAIPINGDMPILEVKDDGVYAYGTPWCGKERYGTNTSAKLKGIAILNRSDNNHIEKCDKNDVFDFLLDRTYKFSNSPISQLKMVKLLKVIVDNVPLYNLYVNMDKEAAYVAYYGMK